MTVKGSYAKIPLAWKELILYAEKEKIELEGHAIELYIIDNHDTGDENEYITQLQIKVREWTADATLSATGIAEWLPFFILFLFIP